MAGSKPKTIKLRRQVNGLAVFFMLAITLSGITAFPLQAEVEWLLKHPGFIPSWANDWVNQVATGVRNTGTVYPFILYGTDWLAFAHIIIAILFFGVVKDPVRNIWVVEWAIICCLLVFPLAFIAGPIRDIPMFHILIDCSFGVLGLIPLAILRKKILLLKDSGG